MITKHSYHLLGDCKCGVTTVHFRCKACDMHVVDETQPCPTCGGWVFITVIPHSDKAKARKEPKP